MRAFITFFLLSGCINISSDYTGDSVITAQPYVGLQERQNRSELKEFTGVDPVRVEWCAAFVNAVLELDDIPGSDSVSDYPLTARSFIKWGNRVEPKDIQRGDVVVFPRGNSSWQGHVGFFVEEIHGRWIILGGNQENSVRYDIFEPARAISIRRFEKPVDN